MSRYTEASCKLCRREGQKLFLKGERCYTDKCGIERKNFAPGQHGRMAGRRRKVSDYSLQLREKQKTKRIYGVLEKVVYRLGLAPSHKSARQLVRHRHIQVNGGTVDIPSYQVVPGQEICVKEKSRNMGLILSSIERRGKQDVLPWLSVDYKTQTGKLLEIPTRADIPTTTQEQLVVELYSK